jgi:rfaE bifunctional protein kinase chain/domain
MISPKRVSKILSSAKGKTVLALGDVMLDCYVSGNVKGISQEAPVPIVSVDDEKFFPGGAGNSAACMAAIGLKPVLVSIVGNRGRINYAQILQEECERLGINPHFHCDSNRKTTFKLRLAAVKTTKQHVARVDIEDKFPPDSETEKNILAKIHKLFHVLKPLAISIHDYQKGFLTEKIFEMVCHFSRDHRLPVFADLKQETFVNFFHLILEPKLFHLKPNRNESVQTARLINGFDKDGSSDVEIVEIAKIIQKKTPIKIVITRGSRGAVSFEPGKNPFFVQPKQVEEQFDVAGAGDTVEAFLVAAHLGGASMTEALEIAVAASQVAIRKFGTSVVFSQEVIEWLKKTKS